VANGGFGPSRPEYIRLAKESRGGEGVVIGCEISPGWGFVIQVAVRRAHWGRGLGAALLNDLAAEFRKAGLKHMGLGVTSENPARRLYERLGFHTLREVDAFVWWR
jgi:ribosomal protein S18 acetylase RimI-like enzyme